jgi:class 3 adenylate cyclase
MVGLGDTPNIAAWLQSLAAPNRVVISERTQPLVGREEELARVLRRWPQARAGEGQVVLLTGEPGSRTAWRSIEPGGLP